MLVQVRTRCVKRQSAETQIVQVGSQMEPIIPALLPLSTGKAIETGLPVLVSRPPGLKIRPGEVVDLIIKPN
jgi:hypothetical protein